MAKVPQWAIVMSPTTKEETKGLMLVTLIKKQKQKSPHVKNMAFLFTSQNNEKRQTSLLQNYAQQKKWTCKKIMNNDTKLTVICMAAPKATCLAFLAHNKRQA